MRKTVWLPIICLSVLFSLSGSCRNSDSDDPPSAEPDIFIGGYTRNGADIAVPCVWKNGTRSDLSVIDPAKDGSASGIYVDGNQHGYAWSISGYGGDVYISGATTNSYGVMIPCYWRNGGRNGLSVLDTGKNGEANSIFTQSQ
jgi:hypothetical protein